MKDFYVKISNDWIRCNKPNPKKILAYYLLYSMVGQDEVGAILPRYAVSVCGYKNRKGTQGVDQQFEDAFVELRESGYFAPLDGYTISKGQGGFMYRLNFEQYNPTYNFTTLSNKEFHKLVRDNQSRNRDKDLIVYLYVKSFFNKGSSKCGAVAFFQSVENMVKVTGLSKNTIGNSLDHLVEMGMLFKQNVNKQKDSKGYFPNFYMVNIGQSAEAIKDCVYNTKKYIKSLSE